MTTLVIGAGPAGLRCAEKLAALGPVTVIGAEPGLPYNRVALSQYLAGDVAEAGLITHSESGMAALGITYLGGTAVTRIDRHTQMIVLDDGSSLPYGRLVLALGSTPFRLPLPGADLPGVLMYRTLDEVRIMLATAAEGGRAIVIGGGLLGLEAAVGLSKRGMYVTVVHAVDRLMERQLDHAAAAMLTRRLHAQGIAVVLDAASAEIVGAGRARGLKLGCGRVLPADLIVMAVGIRPNVELAREAGLATARGIIVDDAMRTSDPAISAIGECAEHHGQCCGLVAPAMAQAETAARAIAGEAARYRPVADATALKIAGAGVWSAGETAAADSDSIIYNDPEAGEYRRFLLRDQRLVGAVLYGETVDAPWYKSLLGQDVSRLRATLAFGQSHAAPEHAP